MKKLLALVLGMIVVGSLGALAQRTSVSGDFPVYANGGRPDLTIDPKRFVSQMEIVDRYFDPNDCAVAEGTVGGSGYRRLLRFDTDVMNMGDADLVVGDPTDSQNPYADLFIFATCHQHYHIVGFSDYQLLNSNRVPVALGHKQAFCLEDIVKYSNDNRSNGYTCRFQGITSGWADYYFKQLSGQWIDITGVPEGDYIVHNQVNAAHTFDEGQNRYPDVMEVVIHVPDPRKKVTIDNSPLSSGG